MLSDKVDRNAKLKVHGFLIGVELENNSIVDGVMQAIAEALVTFRGVGTVDVEHLGEIETIDEVGAIVNDLPPGFDGMKES